MSQSLGRGFMGQYICRNESERFYPTEETNEIKGRFFDLLNAILLVCMYCDHLVFISNIIKISLLH